MSQATAFCFLLSGAALGLMRSQRLAEAMALGAAVIGGFALLGYALGSEQLYHVPGFVSMAVHTAAAFVFLVAGILCAIPQGVVALLLRSSRTGRALWLGLGVLTAFLGATGVISVYLQGSLKTGVKKQGEVNLPRSATVNEIEINIIEYDLAVRKHINGEPNARATAANEALEVAHHAAVYERLAETAVQRELAAHFAVLWREFHALGEALMEARPPGREELARFGAMDRRLDQFLDEVMQPDALAVFEAGRAINVRSVHNTELLTVMLLLAGIVLALLTSSAVARTVLGGEAALRESEERLRQLLRVLPVAVYTCAADGSITFFNNRAVELWGREPRLATSGGSFRRRRRFIVARWLTAAARGVADGQGDSRWTQYPKPGDGHRAPRRFPRPRGDEHRPDPRPGRFDHRGDQCFRRLYRAQARGGGDRRPKP